MAKSAKNRHHRERLIARWLNQHPVTANEHRAVNEAEWRFKAARLYVNTRKACSCSRCTSPRKRSGNGKAGKTFQELRHTINYD